MFEKEAEELDKMAEKAYAKDIQYIGMSANITYKLGFKAGYNKANEWHFVKDGINPTHSYRVLVFTDEGVGFGIYGLDDKKWHTYDTGFEVIAWKEIVLPELKESEK